MTEPALPAAGALTLSNEGALQHGREPPRNHHTGAGVKCLYTFKHHFFSNVPRSTSDGRAWVLGAVFFFVFSLARLQQSDCCRGGGSLRFAPRTQHASTFSLDARVCVHPVLRRYGV